MPTLDAKSILLSPHAVDRFMTRYRSSSSTNPPTQYQALLDLVDAAVYVGTTVGGELWQAPDASGQQIPFIVRRDPKAGREVLVTVLPPHAAAMLPEDLDDVVAAYQRLTASVVEAERPVTLHRDTPCPPKAATAGGEVKAPTTAAEDKANRAIALEWVRFAANKKKEEEANANLKTARIHATQHPASSSSTAAFQNRLDGAAKKIERLNRARDHQEAELKQAKATLRIALRVLVPMAGSEPADTVLEQIRAVNPGFLTAAFVTGDKNIPAEERRRQTDEARAAYGYDPDAWKRVEGVEEAQA